MPVFLGQPLQEVELAGTLQPFAAVDGDDLAVDVAREIAEQEGGEIGELDMLADALQRILRLSKT